MPVLAIDTKATLHALHQDVIEEDVSNSFLIGQTSPNNAHAVRLSDTALSLLKKRPRNVGKELIFHSQRRHVWSGYQTPSCGTVSRQSKRS